MKMFPHRIRLPVLMFIIFGFYQVSKSQKPIIIANSRQIVINEGETLNITCTNTEIRPIDLQQSESFNENWKTVYKYNFFKKNAVLSDTGWYCCVSFDPFDMISSTEYYYNTEMNWFFVYVKEPKAKEFLVNLDPNPPSDVTTITCTYQSTVLHAQLIKGNTFEISKTFGKKKTLFDLKVTLTLNTSTWEYSYNCPIETINNEMRLDAINYMWLEEKNSSTTPSISIVFYLKENVTFNVQKSSGDNVELGAAVYEDGEKLFLQWINPNGTKIVNSPKYYVRFERYADSMVTFALLQIIDANVMDSGNYMLQAQNDHSTARKNFSLDVIDVILPFFTYTNMNGSKTRNIDMITEGYNTMILKCFADGMPKPKVTWYKDNVLLKENKQYLIKYQELHIKYFMPNDSGTYSCRAISRVGTNEAYQQITVKYECSTLKIILTISISILGFILVILAIFITINVCQEMKMRKKLVPDLIYFDGVTLEYVNPNLTVKDKTQFLPIDKKWEFTRERLKLKEQLDSGNFGVVMKAEALGMCKNETVTTVAVKMVRQSDDPTYLCALVSELKIMLHLGKHLNVVNLLGTCTKNILKGELLVITEYCRFGNLHKYLLSHRYNFIDQIDSKIGKLDFTIGADILKTTANVGNDSSAKSDTDVVVQDYTGTNPDSSEVNILSECVHNSNLCQPKRRSNNCRKYKNQHFKPICTQDLLSWSFQVARGMEYLSQRKVLHGDLAARNILLADDNIVKICDFGLPKDMNKDYYKKKGNAPIPIKWMAIESIGNRVFSTQSDVWSFGIMLWEFFTLAKVPYPGIVIDKLYQKLIEGYRMKKPNYAIPEIYDIMLQCWEAKPTSRPSFTNLVESIGVLLEESVRTHYISLNTPYLDMNEENLNVNPGCSKEISNPILIQDHSCIEFQSTEPYYEDIKLSPMLKHEEDAHLKPIKITHSHLEFPSPESDTIELTPMLKHEEDAHLKPIKITSKEQNLSDEGKQ